MRSQIGEFQAKVYVYDLNNCAREFGFKADEVWEVSLATDAQKADIENKYFPTISVKALPGILSEMFDMVKEKLTQVKSEMENKLDKNSITKNNLQYLVAFNPGRQRR